MYPACHNRTSLLWLRLIPSAGNFFPESMLIPTGNYFVALQPQQKTAGGFYMLAEVTLADVKLCDHSYLHVEPCSTQSQAPAVTKLFLCA